MLCNVHSAKDELEERRSRGGRFVKKLSLDLGAFAWTEFAASEFAGPAHCFLHYLHRHSRLPHPLRSFLVLGIMSDHTPLFFERQLRSPNTQTCIRILRSAGVSPIFATHRLYPDLLITILLHVVATEHPAPRVVSSIYALIDELLGYALGDGTARQVPLTAQKLPDVTQLMPIVALHCNSKPEILREYPDADEATVQLIAFLVEILFKLMPYRCNNREFFRLLEKVVTTGDPLLLEFVAKVLAASWLGVYDHCTVRADIPVRIEVYRFLQCVERKKLAAFFTAERSIVAMYMFKEYFCEMCRVWPGFALAIPSCNWTAYIECTRLVGDTDIRAPGSLAFGFFGFPVTRPSRAAAIHDEYRKWQIHTTVDYDLKTILDTFDVVAFANYPYDSCIFRPGQEHLMPDPRPWLPRARLDILRSCVDVLETSRPDFSWLVCHGAARGAITDVRRAIFCKQPDLKRVLARIARDDIVSFSVLFSFFALLAQHTAYTPIPGDQEMVVSQTLAVARHYNLADGDRIPETAAGFFVCVNCGDVKRQSFYRKDRKTPTTGFGKIRVNADGTLVCARKPKDADWQEKHLYDHGEHPEASHLSRQRAPHTGGTPATLRRKFAKYAASQHVLHRCIHTPLVHINALGCVAVYDKTAYVACYGCARVVPSAELRRYGNRFLCVRCTKTQKKTETVRMEGCVICGAFRRGRMRTFFLYDDFPRGDVLHRPRLREVNICAMHNPMSWVIPSEMVYLSRVLYEIFHRRGFVRADENREARIDNTPVPPHLLEPFIRPVNERVVEEDDEDEDESDDDDDE